MQKILVDNGDIEQHITVIVRLQQPAGVIPHQIRRHFFITQKTVDCGVPHIGRVIRKMGERVVNRTAQ
jgi:hypothetical protein